MLRSYYQHVCKYENSLVTKFYGVHCVKPIGGQKVRGGRPFILFDGVGLCISVPDFLFYWKPDPVHCDGQSFLLRVSNP